MGGRRVPHAEPPAQRPGTLSFSDHFASRAGAYARFRPRYPPALFDLVAGLPAQRRLALDAGTGSGQAATALAERFERVVGIDGSAAQLAEAAPHERVEYRLARAEATGLSDRSTDLVTVAQAAHWFDLERFFGEVRRIAAPGGAIALWSYDDPVVVGDPATDAVLQRFTRVAMGPWWPPQRRHVGAGYARLPFPFDEVRVEPMTMAQDWTREHLAGYARSWSAVSAYAAARGEDPVLRFEEELAGVWPSATTRRVEWPLHVRAGRV